MPAFGDRELAGIDGEARGFLVDLDREDVSSHPQQTSSGTARDLRGKGGRH